MDTSYLVYTILVCSFSLAGGEEFQANVRSAGNQCNVAIAAERDGRFALAWSSYFSGSGRSNEIIARRFEATGTATGAEFQVNTTRAGNQTEPAIASSRQGYLFVVWQGPGKDGAEDVFARLLGLNNESITDEFRANSNVAGRQLYPRVSACEDKAFVVVWENRQAGEAFSIRGQLFDGAGGALGHEFSIADDNRDCRYPDVAMDGRGNFVAVWVQERSSNTIFARRFGANGVARTEPFAVSVARISSVTRPSVAMCQTGGFVVVWDGDPDLARQDDIHARCFEPNGVALSDPFFVNAYREGRQQWPRVAMDEYGTLVVAWQHEQEDGNHGSEIFARRFNPDGRPAGSAFQLNGTVAGRQRHATVALSGYGSVIGAWESDDQDSSGYGIFARVEPGADLNGDLAVDLLDLCLLGQSWGGGEHDLTGDGMVDVRDLAALCRYWLE